ncbi:MAG: hypothetical protein ACE5HT_09415 [Gemmatimonadales bacterium]
MKKAMLAFSLMLVLAIPGSLLGQGSEPPSDIVVVTTIRVLPKDAARFGEAVGKIVQAAKEANLGAEFGWSVWTDQFTYDIVGTEKNMAALDGSDGRWMEQFEGTPGRATLEAAFEALNEIPSENLGSEIVQVVPGWSYKLDEISPGPGFAEVCEYAIAAGMEEKFDAVYKNYIAISKRLDYPYPHIGHRFRYGSPARHVGVTIYDTKEHFFGKNDIERLVEQKGETEAWGKLIEDFLPTVTGVECKHTVYVPEMSYESATETSSN